MAGYNKLTKQLLAAGYTADNFPKDKVHIAHGCYSRNGNPLDNIYGGFEYNRIYYETFIYKTGCGMFVKGKNVLTNMGVSGEEWCHENDNPVVRCPYDKSHCPQNDSRLYGERGGGLCIQCWCVCHRTDEPYEYENSFEKADKERHEEMERKYQEYSDAHSGRVCRRHMYYDERKREWHLSYEPAGCARMCYSGYEYCPILGKQLSTKRGNVYYDLKKSGIRRDGTLFDGEEWVSIEKGRRFFDNPVSMDICEAFIKVQSEEILHWYQINHSTEWMCDKDLKVEVLNIRAESRPSRDLLQDLQDIKAGIEISHASDTEKQVKEQKREKRQKAKEKRIQAIEKKIMEIGYGNMEWVDQNRACKLLDFDRIDELEELRQQKLTEAQEKPTQITMFDFIQEGGSHEEVSEM